MILKRSLTVREWTLAAGVLVAVVTSVLLPYWIMPAYDHWSALRVATDAQRLKLAQLERNLMLRESVDARFAELAPQTFQTDSNEITLSQFLRSIERAARLPSLTLINMSPGQVRVDGPIRRYPVRLAISARVEELVTFCSELFNGLTVTKLESFSMRGLQQPGMVECTFSLSMVRVDQSASP